MEKLTRKELKTDRLVETVSGRVEYLADHRKQAIIWGCVALGVLVAGLGGWQYMRSQKAARIELLSKGYMVMDSPVGPAQGGVTPPYATEAERRVAAVKAFDEVTAKYPGSEEAMVARYFLATQSASQAKWTEAEGGLKEVSSKANADLASLASFSLAQVYAAQDKIQESEKLLRALIDKPTTLVSKEQAQVTLGRLLLASRPEEAKKLLEPLRTARSAVSRAAVNALGEGSGTPQQ